jgi:hypothetical protein
MPITLLLLFSQVCDPRRGQGKMYPLAPILLFTVLAMLTGAVSYRQVHAFVRTHLDRLNSTFGVFLRKAPAYTTLRFILQGLDGSCVRRESHAQFYERPEVQFLRPTHHRNHYVLDVSANEDRSRIRNNPGIPARAPPMGALAPPIRLKTYE